MARLLVLILLGGLIYLLLGRRRRARSPTPKQTPPDTIANMVACAHCGVHIPDNEALMADGHPYCCAAHRQHGPRQR